MRFCSRYSTLLALFSASTLISEAWSQDVSSRLVPPEITLTDAVGVDLISGRERYLSPEIKAGSTDSGIRDAIQGYGGDPLGGGLNGGGGYPIEMVVNDQILRFFYDAARGVYASTENSGYIKEIANVPFYNYEYFSPKGENYYFSGVASAGREAEHQYRAILSKIIKPDNEKIEIDYTVLNKPWTESEVIEDQDYCGGEFGCFHIESIDYNYIYYLARNVKSNLGWARKYDPLAALGGASLKSAIINSSETNCVVSDYQCYVDNSSTFLSIGYSAESSNFRSHSDNFYTYYSTFQRRTSNFVDAVGGITKHLETGFGDDRQAHNSSGIEYKFVPEEKIITFPSGRLRRYTYDYVPCLFGEHEGRGVYRVKKLTLDGQDWNYAYTCANGANGLIFTTLATDPNGGTRTFRSGLINGSVRLLEAIDEMGRKTTYDYDSVGRILRVIPPEATYSGTVLTGGYTQYGYSGRGNLVETRTVAKAGFGAADIVQAADYPSACDDTNYKICNKPVRVRDARGGQTDYEYSPVHGGVTLERAPVDGNGVRRETHYEYTPLYAKIRDASGNLVNAESPVYRLIKVSVCTAAPTCVGSVNEHITEYAYNNNNLMLTSVMVRNGDNSLSATTSYTYDIVGNVTSVDGPRTDVDDRSYTTYDLLRRKVFEVGVDPDAGGPLKRPVIKHYYDADGLEIRIESGVGEATDGSDFVWATAERMTYDGVGRLTRTEVVTP